MHSKDLLLKDEKKLEDSYRWHQYNFDADSEQQWIKDHLPIATSTNYGKNAVDCQNLMKKHQKFEVELTGHQPMIEKVLNCGDQLIDENHFASKNIKKTNSNLKDAWNNLLVHAGNRKDNL